MVLPNLQAGILVTLIVFLSATQLELALGPAGLAPEVIILSLGYIIFLNSKSNRIAALWLCLCLSASYLVLTAFAELLVTGNSGALYELNFLLLIFAIPFLHRWMISASYTGSFYVTTAFLLLAMMIVFFPNKGGAFDHWDQVTLDGSGVLNRLSVYGYVSNTLACILLMFIVYGRYKKKSPVLSYSLTVTSIYWLFQTYSRTGILVLGILILWELFSLKQARMLVIPLLLVFGVPYLVFSTAHSLDILDLAFGVGRGLNSVRFENWADLLANYKSSGIFSLGFGQGFFLVPTDNTFLGLLLGKGIIGSAAYLLLAMLLIIDSIRAGGDGRAYIAQILTIMIIFAFTMDFYGQRKIILFAAVIIAAIVKDKYETRGV